MSWLAKLGLAVVAAFAALLGTAAAQDYPSRSVRIVVPFGAGGPADLFARFIGQHLQESLKQPFVVEARPGAGSLTGTQEVAKSEPDGYTLLMMSNTHTVNERDVAAEPALRADARLRASGAASTTPT
jgi:tripartite-type tricarboxylate transporter receptor subunit TctC